MYTEYSTVETHARVKGSAKRQTTMRIDEIGKYRDLQIGSWPGASQ
jgi:hypothetical protein